MLLQCQIQPLASSLWGEDYFLLLQGIDPLKWDTWDENLGVPVIGESLPHVPLRLFLELGVAYSLHWEYGGLYLQNGDIVGMSPQVPKDFQLTPEEELEAIQECMEYNHAHWVYRSLKSSSSSSSWRVSGDGMRESRMESSYTEKEEGVWEDSSGRFAPVPVSCWWVNGSQFGSLAMRFQDKDLAVAVARLSKYANSIDQFAQWKEENKKGLAEALHILQSPDWREVVNLLLLQQEAKQAEERKAKEAARKEAALAKERLTEELAALQKKPKTKIVKERIEEINRFLR